MCVVKQILCDGLVSAIITKTESKCGEISKKQKAQKSLNDFFFNNNISLQNLHSGGMDTDGLFTYFKENLDEFFLNDMVTVAQPEYFQKICIRYLGRTCRTYYDNNQYNTKDIVDNYACLLSAFIKQFLLDTLDDKQLLLLNLIVHNIHESRDSICNDITFFREGIKAKIEQGEQLNRQHIDYRGSFCEYIDNAPEKKSENVDLHYLNPKIKLHGRTNEIILLSEFINSKLSMAYCAICESGGEGKSKLVFEFLNRENTHDWKKIYINKIDIQNLLRFSHYSYPGKLLIVADYACANAEDLGELVLRISENNTRPQKLRIIFIERQSFIVTKQDKFFYPLWFDKFLGTGERKIKLLNLGYLF